MTLEALGEDREVHRSAIEITVIEEVSRMETLGWHLHRHVHIQMWLAESPQKETPYELEPLWGLELELLGDAIPDSEA